MLHFGCRLRNNGYLPSCYFVTQWNTSNKYTLSWDCFTLTICISMDNFLAHLIDCWSVQLCNNVLSVSVNYFEWMNERMTSKCHVGCWQRLSRTSWTTKAIPGLIKYSIVYIWFFLTPFSHKVYYKHSRIHLVWKFLWKTVFVKTFLTWIFIDLLFIMRIRIRGINLQKMNLVCHLVLLEA